MVKVRIAVTLDRLVEAGVFLNRSQTIEAAVQEKFGGFAATGWPKECESALADEGYVSRG